MNTDRKLKWDVLVKKNGAANSKTKRGFAKMTDTPMNEENVKAPLTCDVCPHHCRIPADGYGRCRARRNNGEKIVCVNYGKLTSIALDPIEKKPLACFHPGSMILSVGSYGCNLSCPFCQNHEIAAARESDFLRLYDVTPEKLCTLAIQKKPSGNIGIAYTYNEALVGYEYVRDCSMLIHAAGMKNVLVTNGTAELHILEEIIPYIDAMNIDLKGFSDEIYEKLGGDFETVKNFITRSAQCCHVELTTLIVPGLNDSPEDMKKEAEWIADIDPSIPLHITRYFPRYKMHENATDIAVLKSLKDVASENLKRVFLGNV